MTDRASPELPELIAAAIDSRLLNVRVAGPGLVKSYDTGKRVATVQPAVRRPLEDEDGSVVQEEDAPVQNVPVVMWGGAKLSITHVVQPGDVVILVYFDFSPALFRKRRAVSDTPDTRKNGPSYPIAFPWFFQTSGNDADESIGVPGGLRIHFTTSAVKVGTGSDFVAMAAKTDARLTALEAFATAQAAFNTEHVHTGVTPGILSSGTAGSGPPFTAGGGPTASSNLKAD